MKYRLLILFAGTVFYASCSQTESKATLADIDVSNGMNTHSNVFVKPKSEAEIKAAYYNYIHNASKNDQSRQAAMNRIAAMELNLTNKILANSDTGSDEDIEDKVYVATLKNAVELLTTSLHDFPEAKDNDDTLYQLARTYDQLSQYQPAIDALRILAEKHMDSPFYAEAQFRLGEHAFITGDYIGAEDAYTEVILTPTNDRFYEKALFKRGWARYKQELYREAVDDYLQALTYHQFDDKDKLDKSQRDQFDEYFRSIGLVFSHLRGAKGLNEYFADKQNFRYLFHTYTVVADIYQQQERYSDAVETLNLFVAQYPKSNDRPLAHLKILEIWQKGNFTDRVRDESEHFYVSYNPNSSYWGTNENNETRKLIEKRLREYIVLVTGYFHSQYQKKPTKKDYTRAAMWYERYLSHYSNFAQQDNIYTLYANLLAAENDNAKAIGYFELAAYDGELVLDKDAAYAMVVLSNELVETVKPASKPYWQKKHITYAQRYVGLYPNDRHASDIIAHAAELSFNSGDYASAVALADSMPQRSKAKTNFGLNNIKARSYLEQSQFSDAEASYQDLLSSKQLNRKQHKAAVDSAALSIYRQAEQSRDSGDTATALKHFSRISETYPSSNLAITGLYDAVSLAMKNELWNDAIFYSESYQVLYPGSSHSKEVSRQLSVAYLNSNQGDKAARQFERLAREDDNADVKMAALWQAAELYDSQKNIQGSIRSYRDYAHAYPSPYPQNIEAMYRLAERYHQLGDSKKRYFWQVKIKNTDKRASNRLKNERTNFIAASTTLDLANQKREEFNRTPLKAPLAKNLKLKKSRMQDAIKMYGQASSYNLTDITTQSTFNIGDIYREFSISLLESERPNNLDDEELEQYNILLEDQAFPFEEKAIEFYETNLSRVKDGTSNEWTQASLQKLKVLFPVRFNRKGKAEVIRHAAQ